MAKKKHLNLSNDQLAKLKSDKKHGQIIVSRIKEGERFVLFTLIRDIKQTFFNSKNPLLIRNEDCVPFLYGLVRMGYIHLLGESNKKQDLSLFICLKTWNSQSLQFKTKTEA